MAAIEGSATIGANAVAVATAIAASSVLGAASIGTTAAAASTNAISSVVTGSANVGTAASASSSASVNSAVTGSAVIGCNGIAATELIVGGLVEGIGFIGNNANASISGALVIDHQSASASIGSYAVASANIVGGSDTDGLSICEIVDRTLETWGIFCRKGATKIEFAIARAVSDINHALQLVWSNAEGRTYWTNETITVTVSADASSEDLPDNIQNVTGTCRRADNKQPLTLIGTVGELETFNDSFLDGEQAESPIAYHIERLSQSGNEPARCIFHVNQAVDDDTDFLLEVVREAPRYSPTDIDTCPLIPIPHQYVESLLLPIVRYQASTFYLFRQMDQKPAIEAEYKKALEQLGLSDPLPNFAGDNRKNGGEG